MEWWMWKIIPGVWNNYAVVHLFWLITDYSKPFILHTDACNLGLGAVLYQTDEDSLDRVIAYASRTLSKSERNYPAYKLEFLALKWAITDKFHEYLYGGNFDVYVTAIWIGLRNLT